MAPIRLSSRAPPIRRRSRRHCWPIPTPRSASGKCRNRRLPSPSEIYQPLRANSKGVEFGDAAALSALLAEVEPARGRRLTALPSQPSRTPPRACLSPIDGVKIGLVIESDAAAVAAAMQDARRGFEIWSAASVETRATIIERAADLIEARRGPLIALLQGEAGKTLDDALARCGKPPIFAAITRARRERSAKRRPCRPNWRKQRVASPRARRLCLHLAVEFPLAIFIGQVAAALVTGNGVAAKPAEQTPLVAFEAISLLYEAGVSREALQFLPGAATLALCSSRIPLARAWHSRLAGGG